MCVSIALWIPVLKVIHRSSTFIFGCLDWAIVSSLTVFKFSVSSFILALWNRKIFLCFCFSVTGFVFISMSGIPSWSLMPGQTMFWTTRDGWVVINKSSILSCLVGSFTICSIEKSQTKSNNWREMVGFLHPGSSDSESQLISPKLKSPPRQMMVPLSGLILSSDCLNRFK